MFNIFVYGTILEEDNIMHKMLETFCTNKIPAQFKGRMFTSGYYPFVIDGENIVNGYVYTLTDGRFLDILDYYEGIDRFNFYKRVKRPVEDMFHNVIISYIYKAENDIIDVIKDDITEIKTGNWLDYKLGQIDKNE